MSIDKTELDNIARLARLKLDDDDSERYLTDLGRILDLVEQMNEVDTADVIPLAHPLEINARLRTDEVTESDQRDYFQEQAPAVEDGYYLVPRVIE